MPIQLTVWERRDALDWCRLLRARDGIRSSRFYWLGADNIIILTEGETAALNAEDTRPELARAGFTLSELARATTNWPLGDARAGEETYRRAGR